MGSGKRGKDPDLLDVQGGGSPEKAIPPDPSYQGTPPPSASSFHFVAEEQPSKKYFAQIPNLYDDAGLTVYEFRLLVHYVRVGDCWEGTRHTAETCAMSVGSVVKARNSLEAKGFIRTMESEWGTKRIIILDKWAENMEKYRSPDERDRSPHEHPRSPGETKNNKGRITNKNIYNKFSDFWDSDS